MLQDVRHYSMQLLTFLAITSLKASIRGHELLQHVRYQRHGVDSLSVGLGMQRSVAVKDSLQACRANKSQLDGLIAG